MWAASRKGIHAPEHSRAKLDESGKPVVPAEKREKNRLRGVAERVADKMLADGLELRERVELFELRAAAMRAGATRQPSLPLHSARQRRAAPRAEL